MQLSSAFTVEISTEHLAQAVAERVVLLLREQPAEYQRPAPEANVPRGVRYGTVEGVAGEPGELEHEDHDVRRHRADDGFTGVLVSVLLLVGTIAATVPAWLPWLT